MMGAAVLPLFPVGDPWSTSILNGPCEAVATSAVCLRIQAITKGALPGQLRACRQGRRSLLMLVLRSSTSILEQALLYPKVSSVQKY